MCQKAVELTICQSEFHVFKQFWKSCSNQADGGMVKELIIVPKVIQIIPDYFERVPQN